MIRLVIRTALAASLAAGVACNDSAGPDPIDTTGQGQQLVPCTVQTPQQSLPVLGCGVVARTPYTAEVAARGARAYTTTYSYSSTVGPGNVVNVWDVSGNAPVLVDTLQVAGTVSRTSDISIADDGSLMVVSTEPAGTLAIYQLAGTAKPQLVTLWAVPNVGSPGIHTVKLARVGGKLYAFAQGTSAARGVSIIDMSAPATPVVVGQIGAANYIHDVFVRDGLAFVADWDAGVGIWDIGDGRSGGSPALPVFLARAPTRGGNAHNVWWFHDPAASTGGRRYIFVGEEQAGGIGSTSAGDLHVVDISNLAAPREVAIYRVNGAGAHNFSMDEAQGILYAAFYNGGVRALDVRGDLSACTDAQREPGGLCDLRAMGRERAFALASGGTYIWGVQFDGTAVYASDMLNGIWKLRAVTR